MSRAALGYLQIDHKMRKNKAEELEKYKPELQFYVKGIEYRELTKKLKAKDDDDEYRHDPDPKGMLLWEKFLTGKFNISGFVQKVTQRNSQDAHLHAKAIVFWLAEGKIMLALKSAICLHERHPNHPRTPAALAKFFAGYMELEKSEGLFDAVGKNQTLMEVIQQETKEVLGCPETEAEAMEAAAANLAKLSSLDFPPLDYAVQAAKLCKYTGKPIDEASLITALKSSNKQVLRMKTVIKAHSFLVKNGSGEVYAKQAKEMFPMCTHFKQ